MKTVEEETTYRLECLEGGCELMPKEEEWSFADEWERREALSHHKYMTAGHRMRWWTEVTYRKDVMEL
jgi:hypothetical protein